MSFTTYGDISQRTAAYAAVEALEHAQPILCAEKFAVVKPIPKNTAETVKFRRPIPFPVSTTQIQEGVTPPPMVPKYEDISATIGQYGGWVQITDRVADMSEDPVLKDVSMLFGENAAETREMILFDTLKGGTTRFFADTADTARNQVDTPISLARQRAVVKYLKNQRAQKITKMLAASPKIATEPVNATYVAFAHSDLEPDIRDMAGFVPVEKYGTFQPLHEWEIGKVEEVRYIVTPLLEPWKGAGAATAAMVNTGGNADVYPVIYIGANSYATVPLRGANGITLHVENPGKASKSDPLGQTGFASWKSYITALRLNEAWMARLEVAAALV